MCHDGSYWAQYMSHCYIYSDTLWDHLGQILCMAQHYISAKTVLFKQVSLSSGANPKFVVN